MKEEILSKIQEIIEDIADIPQDEIEETSAVVDDLEMSSMEIFSMLGELENIYGVRIPDNELKRIITIGDLAEYIDGHR